MAWLLVQQTCVWLLLDALEERNTTAPWRKVSKVREINKISTSLLVNSLWKVWMLSGLWTDTASAAAVKPMGSSCLPGDGELCWSLHCACQSAGQLQRGKFKNGFWRIKCNTAKYSTGARERLTLSSNHPKQVSLFYYVSFSESVFVGFLFFMRMLTFKWFLDFYYNFILCMRDKC